MRRGRSIPYSERKPLMVCSDIWGLSRMASKKSPGASWRSRNVKKEMAIMSIAACRSLVRRNFIAPLLSKSFPVNRLDWRHGGEKLLCVGVFGMSKQVPRCLLFHNLSSVHDGHLVRISRDQLQIR